MGKKYYYRITKSGECVSYGFVLLTKEEAKIVNRALDERNWVRAVLNGWSGDVEIDLDNPISEDEFNFSK